MSDNKTALAQPSSSDAEHRQSGATESSTRGPARSPQVVKFSIVTPTLNAERYLAECMDSVAAQRCEGIEIEHLILDGGSTDRTKAILASYPVTMLPRRPEQGLTAAMCLGFDSAQGDLVSFLGADDLLLPGALTAVADLWRREQRPVLFTRTRWATAELQSLGELAPPPRWLNASVHACLGWNYLGAASCFVSPQLYRQLGGFDETFPRAEDYEFYTRVLAQKVPFSRLNRTVCVYRRHGANESVRTRNKSQHELAAIRQRYGPSQVWLQKLLRWGMKSWVYGRNLTWAYHQILGKMAARTTAWREGGPGQ